MQIDKSGSLRAPRIAVLAAALLATLAIVATTSPENTGDAVDYARDAASARPPLRPASWSRDTCCGAPPASCCATCLASPRAAILLRFVRHSGS